MQRYGRVQLLSFSSLPIIQIIYSSTSSVFQRLPEPLNEHSFIDLDVAPPPLAFYPFLYALGVLLFFVFFVLVRAALAILRLLASGLLLAGSLFSRASPTPTKPLTDAQSPRKRDEQPAMWASESRNRPSTFVQALNAIVLAISVGLTLGTHSFIGLFCAALCLGIATSWQVARDKVPAAFSSSREPRATPQCMTVQG